MSKEYEAAIMKIGGKLRVGDLWTKNGWINRRNPARDRELQRIQHMAVTPEDITMSSISYYHGPGQAGESFTQKKAREASKVRAHLREAEGQLAVSNTNLITLQAVLDKSRAKNDTLESQAKDRSSRIASLRDSARTHRDEFTELQEKYDRTAGALNEERNRAVIVGAELTRAAKECAAANERSSLYKIERDEAVDEATKIEGARLIGIAQVGDARSEVQAQGKTIAELDIQLSLVLKQLDNYKHNLETACHEYNEMATHSHNQKDELKRLNEKVSDLKQVHVVQIDPLPTPPDSVKMTWSNMTIEARAVELHSHQEPTDITTMGSQSMMRSFVCGLQSWEGWVMWGEDDEKLNGGTECYMVIFSDGVRYDAKVVLKDRSRELWQTKCTDGQMRDCYRQPFDVMGLVHVTSL